jgi:hypothetical protein
MRSLRSHVLLGSLLALSASIVGCFGPHGEDAESADSDLSTGELGTACSAPVRSEDGKYVLLDVCPAGAELGHIVRLEIANGDKKDVTTYPGTDRIESLSAVGSRFFFGVRHAVDRSGRATAGIDVKVHDWSLTSARTIATAPPSGVDGTFRTLEALMLSADGSHVAYSATDGALANYLFVAPAFGDGAPVGLDLGIASGELRWSASGASFVGHQVDDTSWTGETLVLVDLGAESGATLVGKRHTSFNSFEFGQGGARRQEPFDGTRVVGFKNAEGGQQSVGTVDPRTGEEKILDTAPLLSIVTDLASDILYSRVTEVPEGGGFKRDLVKLPRAGGTPAVLLSTTAPTRDEVAYGFEALALSTTGKVGLFATRQGAPNETAVIIVKLDGSGADQINGKVRFVGQVGERALIENLPQGDGAVASFDLLDLATGTSASIGSSNRKAAHLVGDGTAVQFEECTTAQGAPGFSILQPSTGGPGVALPCARMPWATSAPLAAPNSNALVFYSSYGAFPNYRYDIGIVKP